MNEYLTRIIDSILPTYLQAFGAVNIQGPKGCGKTSTAKRYAQSSFFVDDPGKNFQNRALATLEPSLILQGEHPRLIDEWQEVPPLWDGVRMAVDRLGFTGHFILTGSMKADQKKYFHSGAGRFGRLKMWSMSLFESGDSSGIVSLNALMEGSMASTMIDDVRLKTLATLILRGGWPQNIGVDPPQIAQHLPTIIDEGIKKVDDRRRNQEKLYCLLRALARNESRVISNAALKKDMHVVEGKSVDEDTITNYLDFLDALYLLENQSPFNPISRLRSKRGEKRHFTDPSFAASLLGITEENQLINDIETFELLFEALCIRDLRIYANSFGGELYHYQDYGNNEIDAIVALPNRTWAAFAIVLGAHQIDEAAEKLIKLNAEFKRPASVLGIVCGLTSAAFTLPSGVHVIPITALGP